MALTGTAGPLPSVPEWLADLQDALLGLAEAYKAALDAGMRLDRADGAHWVSVRCPCGSFVAVPARPMHPSCTARRISQFVDGHNGTRCRGE